MERTTEKRFGLYLVTGALGHLGNTLVRQLIDRGARVRGLVLPGDDSSALENVPVELVQGDIRDPASLDALFDMSDTGVSPDRTVVMHTAGIVSIASKFQQKVVDVNVQGTRNIVDACLRTGIGRLVYTSSVHAIPELTKGKTIVELDGKIEGSFSGREVIGLYAKTKAMATRIVLDAVPHGLDAVVVHPSGIVGPGDYGNAHMTQMVLDYMQGRLTAYVRGGYDFVDVRDVAAGMISAAEKGKSGEAYILSNRYVDLGELMKLLRGISGHRRVLTLLPMALARLTAPLAELWYKLLKQPPLFTRYSLYTLDSNAQFSHEKATAELGYHPRPLDETLEDMVAWLRAQGRIREPAGAS
ncbi:MAG: SDR family oxidoreductase [Clostridiaceae bacterium]|nr:SDR family oxidoreductase [Clostridiaceae bacterium]